MKFFTDRRGDHYAISDIHRIGRKIAKREGETFSYHNIDFTNGETVQADEFEVNAILQVPTVIVPAAPGTFFLGGVEADDTSTDQVWQTPIIAFAIGDDNMVTPWTVDGPDDGTSTPSPILFPNGMVIEQAMQSHRSLQEWFDEQKARLGAPVPTPPDAAD